MSFQFGNAHILFQLRLNVPKLESNWKKNIYGFAAAAADIKKTFYGER